MPPWWTPDRRFRFRHQTYRSRAEAASVLIKSHLKQLRTVDLDTGKEVAA
jgi:hypothetical protein